jgi:hypothetical protein
MYQEGSTTTERRYPLALAGPDSSLPCDSPLENGSLRALGRHGSGCRPSFHHTSSAAGLDTNGEFASAHSSFDWRDSLCLVARLSIAVRADFLLHFNGCLVATFHSPCHSLTLSLRTLDSNDSSGPDLSITTSIKA